jgi:hypothetical protein
MITESMRWYRSKVDWWLVPLLYLPPVASLATCVYLALHGKMSELSWGIATILLIVGIYFGLLFPMRYGLDDTHLVVRSGISRQRIPLTNISAVQPTRNPLSSPALSLDRLRVQFGQGAFKSVMISPADRDSFLDELAQKTGLKREEDRLVRV